MQGGEAEVCSGGSGSICSVDAIQDGCTGVEDRKLHLVCAARWLVWLRWEYQSLRTSRICHW